MKRKFKFGNNYLILYDCGTALLHNDDSSTVKCDYYECGDLITIRLQGEQMQMRVEEGGIYTTLGDRWEQVNPFEVQ